ncbi:MAG: VCBS repeat-containing protein [Gemmatimonadota bacterium]
MGQEPVMLRLSPGDGLVSHYRARFLVGLEPIIMALSMYTTESVSGVSGEQWTVSIRMDSARARLRLTAPLPGFGPGETGSLARLEDSVTNLVLTQFRGETRTVQTDAHGRVVSSTTTGRRAATQLGADLDTLPYSLDNSWLPGRAVRVGEAWTDSSMRSALGNTVRHRTSRLERLERQGETQLAVISFDETDTTRAQPLALVSNSHGEVAYDLGSGRVVRLSKDLVVEVANGVVTSRARKTLALLPDVPGAPVPPDTITSEEARAFSVPLPGEVMAAMTAPVPEPQVRLGAGRLVRDSLFADAGTGDVRSLTVFPEGARSDSVRLFVGGLLGAALLGPAGRPARLVRFGVPVFTPEPVDLRGDGSLQVFDRGGGWQPVKLLDAAGHLVWAYPASRDDGAPNAMAAGDLDGDGHMEFVVGMNAGGGLRALNERGEQIWRQPAANVFSVEIADVDYDDRPEILHSHASGEVIIRRANGELLRSLPVDLKSFSLVHRSLGDDALRLVGVRSDGGLVVADLGGRVVQQFRLPDEGFPFVAAGAVRLGPQAEPYLAVVRTADVSQQRSALYLFRANGELVYHEILSSSTVALAVHSARGEEDQLLIGCGSTVWRYRLAPLH